MNRGCSVGDEGRRIRAISFEDDVLKTNFIQEDTSITNCNELSNQDILVQW